MTGIEKKLSETARAALTVAKTRPDHLVRPPRLPIAAARQVVRSLLNGGLVEEVHIQVQDDTYVWRTGEDGVAIMLRATARGLARVDAAPLRTHSPQKQRSGLRRYPNTPMRSPPSLKSMAWQKRRPRL